MVLVSLLWAVLYHRTRKGFVASACGGKLQTPTEWTEWDGLGSHGERQEKA